MYQLIRILITAILAFILSRYIQQGNWLIFTSFILVQIPADSRTKSILISLCTGISIAINVFILNCISTQYLLLAFYLFFTTFITMGIGLRKINYFYPMLVFNLFGMIAAGLHVDFARDLNRVESVFLGTLLASILQSILWLPRANQTLKYLLSDIFATFNKMQLQLFNILLKRDYKDYHYWYEKKLHAERQRIFDLMDRYRRLSNTNQKWIGQLENIFENLIALGSLRYRVQDHSTFEVLEKELKNISEIISLIFSKLCISLHPLKKIIFKRPQIDIMENIENLLDNIQILEGVYEKTLRIVSKDPIVYLIFIQVLKELQSELTILANDALVKQTSERI